MAMGWLEMAAVLAGCYAIGCVSPGYWLVRRRTGEDIRDRHTGSTGARNVGRVLGRGAFATTFALDAAKGALAVGAARSLGLGNWSLIAAALAVTAGQVWPAQLGFRGGRGLSTACGAAFALHPPAAVAAVAVAGGLTFLTGRMNASGAIGIAAVPPIALLTNAAGPALTGVTALVGFAAVTNREVLGRLLARGGARLRR